jgi:hypothetical protein
MRIWIGVILLLFVGVAGADTEPQAALVHIGPDDFTTETLGQEILEGHAHLIVQAEVHNEQIANALGYCRIRAWYDMQDRITRKVLLLDQNDGILTTILFSGYSLTSGTPRASHMEVIDHATGQTSVFDLDGLSQPMNPLTLI